MTEDDFMTDLDKLIAEASCPPLGPEEITAKLLADKMQCFPQRAMNTLKRWEKEGKVEYIGLRLIADGHKVKAWRVVEKG